MNPLKTMAIGLIAAGALAGCDNISASDQAKEATQTAYTSPEFLAAWAGVCFERAKVYRAMATIKERGVSHSEAIGRAEPLENEQMLADLKKVGVSSYVEAVDTIYNSPHPEETVSQLNEECRKAGRN